MSPYHRSGLCAEEGTKATCYGETRWTSKHHDFLSAPPHPSPLMFYLHRARLIQLLLDPSVSSTTNPHNDCPAPLQYARDHLYPYIVSSHQQEIYHLLGALLYTPSQLPTSPYADLLSPSLQPPALVPLFKVEFCRLHGWAREDPLSVVVDLGAGGALSKIDKARKVMKDRLGEVRTWEELPVGVRLRHSTVRKPRSLIPTSPSRSRRWNCRYLCLDATTQSLHAPSRKNKRPTRTRQRCSRADIRSHRTV